LLQDLIKRSLLLQWGWRCSDNKKISGKEITLQN
jgi:hypothetical protein